MDNLRKRKTDLDGTLEKHLEAWKAKRARKELEEIQENDNNVIVVATLPPEVLELIFRKLDVKHVKRCRLVSKSWNKEACRVLKGQLILHLLEGNLFIDHQKLKATAEALDLPSVLEELKLTVCTRDAGRVRQVLSQEPLTSFPVTQLRVAKYGLQECGDADSAWIVSKCAPTLTHLRVYGYNGPDFVLNCLRSCPFPALEVMEIQIYGLQELTHRTDFEKQTSVVQRLIFNVMITSKNLRIFRLCGVGYQLRRSILKHCFTFENIQQLKIMDQASMVEIAFGAEEKKTLRAMSLYCWDDGASTSVILHRFATTLESLEFTKLVLPLQRWEENLPHLPRLQRLIVPTFKLGETWLRKTPSLRRLTVRLSMDLSELPNEMEDLPCFPSVEKIRTNKIHFPEKEHMKAHMAVFKQIFPNVTSWHVDSDCRQLIDFVVSKEGQEIGLRIEELACPLDMQFPPGPLQGLKQFKILLLDNQHEEAIRMREKLKKNKHVPDLEEVTFGVVPFRLAFGE